MSRARRAPGPAAAQVYQWRSDIDALGRNLNRELARLDCGLDSDASFKSIFDRVYLPAARSLADSLAWLRLEELALLRLPLWPALATTQIRIILQVLAALDKLLGLSSGS
jgi:hypothetical protein